MKYDVTIGIPVYKSVGYILRTLESALSQTYASIEYLIVDDGGNDGSMEIVRQLMMSHPRGKHIHIIFHPSNLGVSQSRNDIIDNALGEYLYFLDSDDLMAEHAISLMMQNIQDYEAEIVFGSYEKIEISGNKVVCQYPSMQLFGSDTLASFAYRKYAGIQASSCNYLVKSSILREHQLHFINTNYWEDLVFTYDLVTYIKRSVLLPSITYTYLCRTKSLSHYQPRKHISKDEIMKNVCSIDHLKKTSALLVNKEYYPNRCYNIVLTDFYIACIIIKRRKDIVPVFSDSEIKLIMSHPASFSQICSFQQSRCKNLLFYVIGKLPSFLCVKVIWCIGKIKKLV